MRASFYSLLSLFGAVFVAASVPIAHSSPERLEMSYQLKDNMLTVREPTVLLFKVHNGLEQPVALNLGMNWVQFFEFSLTSPQGRVIVGRPQRSEGLSTQAGELVIEPGQDYQQELLLNQWFELGTPGRYLLTARITTAVDVGGTGTPPPRASLLSLEIKPRNPERLKRVCSDLAKQAVMSSGGEADRQALLKLSYVEDPIAVPYLAQVLSQDRLNYGLAISGLERIGNDAAVEVLLSALSNDYGDIANLAANALARMEDRISNQSLKETVKKALERSSARAHQ